jgi:hypothetical protein
VGLVVTHASTALVGTESEVTMNKTQRNHAARNAVTQFFVSFTTTVWAIGTSAAAGELST